MAGMKQYTDLMLVKKTWWIKAIVDEHSRQLAKWGIQTHSAFEWLTYTAEELGSLAKAIGEHEYRGGSSEDVVKEAMQVVTLALKIAEMFEEEADARKNNRGNQHGGEGGALGPRGGNF